jgi:hypothetical protein
MFSRLSRKLFEIKKAKEVQNENDFTFGRKPSFFLEVQLAVEKDALKSLNCNLWKTRKLLTCLCQVNRTDSLITIVC